MGRDREQGLLQVHRSWRGNGPTLPYPGEGGIREGFPEEMPCKQSSGGVSQAKRRATTFQVEGIMDLLPLRKLQETQSRKQRLGRARAGVRAVEERKRGPEVDGAWGTGTRTLAWAA